MSRQKGSSFQPRKRNDRSSTKQPKLRQTRASQKAQRASRSSAIGTENFAHNVWIDTSRNKSYNSSQRNNNHKEYSNRYLAQILKVLKQIGWTLSKVLMFVGSKVFSFFNRTRNTRIVGIVLVILILGGLGDSLVNMGKIYPGVKVGVVDVGGKTPEEASQLLDDTYQPRVKSNTVTLFASDDAKNNPETSDSVASIEEQISYEEALANRTQWTTPASEVGASFDAETSANNAFQVGRGGIGGVFSRLQSLVFGYTLTPECRYNDELLESLRSSISASVGNPRINYGVQINGAIAEVTEGHDGDEVSETWLKTTLNTSYCGNEKNSSYVIKIEHAPLQVTKDMAQNTADIINTSIAQGVSFTYEGVTWDASRDDLASWITTDLLEENGKYQLKPEFKQDTTKNALLSRASEQINSESLRVAFNVLNDSEIQVTSNTDGKAPEVSEAVNNMNETFFTKDLRSEKPQIDIPSIDIPSQMSFDEAMSLGLIGEISSYTTQFSSGAEARNHNIRTACGYLTNSVAKADGGVWSFNDTAGEATEELGYLDAGVILDGEYTDGIGGGICQVATTIYNAIYDIGYPIAERHNHTLYIASYPEGRDAAIAYPYYDLRWENDTASDVLLVMSYTNTSVTATLYGVDPGYSVSTEYGEWKAGEEYSTKYKDDDTLPAGTEKLKTSGENGREITIVRTVKDSQGNIRSEQTFNSVYDPKDEVILRGTA